MRLLTLALILVLSAPLARAGELAIAETAGREVRDDRFFATLQGRVVAAEPAGAQAELNALMADALDAVPQTAELRVETGAYTVRPERDDDGEVERWVAVQALALDGGDRAALVDAVATLQELGLATRALGSRLSEERADDVRDELIRAAAAAVRARAAVAAAAFDQDVTGWRELRIDGARPMPRAMRADAAPAAAAAAPPALSVGTTTVRVTIEATAELAAADGG